jgi:hypothetical protein
MKKQLALMLLLAVQPIVAFLFWFSMDTLFGTLGLDGAARVVVVIAATAALHLTFCYFFARGFLSSSEARKLGF